MTPRPLDAEVLRFGRLTDSFQVTADPADIPALRDTLRGWLTGGKWSPGLWSQFELVVRNAGEYKIRARVRAV